MDKKTRSRGLCYQFSNVNNFKLQEINFYIFPIYLFTKTNAQFEYAIIPTWQNFDFEFPILGRTVTAATYQYLRQLIRYNSDRSKKVSVSGRFEFGGYYNGRLNTLTLGGRFAPIPHIALTLDYEHNNFINFGLQNDNFTTDLYTVGIRLAANPRLQFSGFYQFNTFNNQGRWNLRGSWELAPLSFLYLVFNESSFRDNPVQNQSFISKLTYVKQF